MDPKELLKTYQIRFKMEREITPTTKAHRICVRSHLHEKLEVNIVGFGRRAPRLLAPSSGDEIDTLRIRRRTDRTR